MTLLSMLWNMLVLALTPRERPNLEREQYMASIPGLSPMPCHDWCNYCEYSYELSPGDVECQHDDTPCHCKGPYQPGCDGDK